VPSLDDYNLRRRSDPAPGHAGRVLRVPGLGSRDLPRRTAASWCLRPLPRPVTSCRKR
jgi:hypothetical protein